MAAHYLNIMVQRQFPWDHVRKGYHYWSGEYGLQENKQEAVVLWEEADKLALACFSTYLESSGSSYVDDSAYGLIPAYMYV